MPSKREALPGSVKQMAFIGGGGRTWRLAGEAAQLRDRMRIVAVADPDNSRREVLNRRLADTWGTDYEVPSDRWFSSTGELLERCAGLDGAFVATPVFAHADAACVLLEAGIPIYLEKPVAHTLADAARIVEAARKPDAKLWVGFNFRHSPFMARLRDALAHDIGQVLSIEWKEVLSPIAWSEYCRHPTFDKADKHGGFFLEKCCHDVDLLGWMLASRCLRVASFGSRSHFLPRGDLPVVCPDGCPIQEECLYSMPRIRAELSRNGQLEQRTIRDVCVYHSGSDLVDQQVALLEYENGVTVAFSLLAIGVPGRSVMATGTKATLIGVFAQNELRLLDHLTGSETMLDVDERGGGHGGSDPRAIAAFLDWLDDGHRAPLTSWEDGIEAMFVACAVERAMREGRVVEVQELRAGEEVGRLAGAVSREVGEADL